MNTQKTNTRERGLNRALSVLRFLREQKTPLRPIEIAKGIGAPKTTIYEIISILVAEGVLEYAGSDGRVFLGRQLHFLANAFLGQYELTRMAQPILDQITSKTKETSQLCMLEGNKYTIVLMNTGRQNLELFSEVGKPTPIPWTASGRLLLSHMTDEQILSYIPDEDFSLPNGAMLNQSEFISAMREARDEGFYSKISEANSETRCFAAPIYDRDEQCVATLCMTTSLQDARDNFHTYRRELTVSASNLTAKLGNNYIS